LFPAHVDRLILDSVVAADGIDPFLLDTYLRMPRVLREQCARRACAGITKDPVADVAKLVGILEQSGLRGRTYDFRGRPRTTRYDTADDLANILIGADLNPYVQAALPAAIRAAAGGDPAMLLRLRRAAAGPPTRLAELSAGLNVTTNCQDARLPYALSTPLDQRPALLEQGLAGYDDKALYPFTHATVATNSIAHDCLLWPATDGISPPSPAPLPDVPTLVLDGRLDLRTPLENGLELARELPRAQVVTVPGTGHDELDSDVTGCTVVALRRFVGDRRVGDPCRGKTNAVYPYPIAPRSPRGFRPAPGTHGRRGRVVSAAIVSAIDARVAVLQDLFAGFERLRGGGLRGGSYELRGNARLILRRYRYVAGVRVSGRLWLGGLDAGGRVRVDGPGKLDGTLVLDGRGGATGTIGGRRIHARRVSGAASAACAGASCASSSAWSVPWPCGLGSAPARPARPLRRRVFACGSDRR
jgi:pimeloyl-ACP methyl ester carboxylesterase